MSMKKPVIFALCVLCEFALPAVGAWAMDDFILNQDIFGLYKLMLLHGSVVQKSGYFRTDGALENKVWEKEDAGEAIWDRCAAMDNNPANIDSMLEAMFAFLEAQALPRNQIEQVMPYNTALLHTVALAHQRLDEIKLLDASNKARIGIYEGQIKYYKDKWHVTDQQINAAFAAATGAVVDKYFGQTGPFGLTPTTVYAQWKREGKGDGIQIIKDKLTAFYLSPTPENLAALQVIAASYSETSDRFATVARSAFVKTVEELSMSLFLKLYNNNMPSAAQAKAAAGAAGRGLEIFGLRYTGK